MKNSGASYTGAVIVPLWLDSSFNDFTLATGSHTNATWYNADKIHLTDAGYTAMADLIFAAISSYL